MHNKKFFPVFLVLILALSLPVMATGAKEKLEEMTAEEAVIETVTVEAPAAEETSVLPSYGTVDLDSLESRFSYSYGYLITSSLLSQGVSINGAYWLRGFADGMDYFSGNFLISTDEMDGIINDYISNYYGAGLTGEVGAMPTAEELASLEAPTDILDQFSYSYALVYAVQLYWMNGLDLATDTFQQGSAEALYLGSPLSLTEDEMNTTVNEYAEKLNQEYEEYVAQITEENLAAAEEFLEQNRENEGIIVLPSGDLLDIVSEDEELGATPVETDTVIVDYDLFLLDGTQMDSGTDVSFDLESLIPGFVEAVTNMKVGQEAYAYIHPDYGYGESGTSSIEPNSLLVFRIYLKGIGEAAAAEETTVNE
jgi:FKBP-type peptidyl-prolyl cis-trans isomerase